MRSPDLGQLGRVQARGHRAVVQDVAPRQEILDGKPYGLCNFGRQCIAGSHMQHVHATTVPDRSVSYCRDSSR
jgi:hypothetical protein